MAGRSWRFGAAERGGVALASRMLREMKTPKYLVAVVPNRDRGYDGLVTFTTRDGESHVLTRDNAPSEAAARKLADAALAEQVEADRLNRRVARMERAPRSRISAEDAEAARNERDFQ